MRRLERQSGEGAPSREGLTWYFSGHSGRHLWVGLEEAASGVYPLQMGQEGAALAVHKERAHEDQTGG